MRLHFEPVRPEGGNHKLIVALRVDGEMQVAAVGAKARENIIVPIAVIATAAGCKVFAAVEMSRIEFPRPRFGLGIRQHALGDETRGLEVGHDLMRRHQVRLAKLVEAVLHVIGRQQAGEIKIHAKKIPHRVGVLSTSESLEGVNRALGENVFLNNLQGTRPSCGRGLWRLLRRHFASLKHGCNGLQQLLIGEQGGHRPVQPHLALLLFWAVALEAVLGEELFQLGFRVERYRQEKAQQQYCAGQTHYDNTSNAPVLSPNCSCSAPKSWSKPRYRLLIGTSCFLQ